MIEYYIKGSDRSPGAIGVGERFGITVVAPGNASRDVLVGLAINARYAAGREHVTVSIIERGPAVASPGATPQGDQA
jgi:hypothetical protein